MVLCRTSSFTLPIIGREWDLQEIHINLISLGGSIDETEDYFKVGWFQ
ncbi:MmoB/DmpM family protein [Acinetobacter junii]